MPKITTFRNGSKSQADQIALLQGAGWREDQTSHDIRRWRDPRTKALYSLHDAVSLLKSYQRTQKVVYKSHSPSVLSRLK
jgi:hypothetical protein